MIFMGDVMEYVDRIIALREDNDIKQEDIAKILGKSQQGYSHLENRRARFTVEDIISLCKFYNLSADYILGFIDEKKELPKK
ncbi:MAG: helix-turn-helix transcriptional regulator [Eubacterium sp.]|nr:helix-turn-helix transcriptional regulator [Eubacterium sp.]MDE6155293.1 helix-turn-helix transcriptional regulator [Eubacterium sp.]MDE6766809.1 helix-turn-helix transcriptional regulator [Eubacterium sp.]